MAGVYSGTAVADHFALMSYDWVHPQAEIWADWTLRIEAHTGHSAESLISRMLRIGHLEPSDGESKVLCLDPSPIYWDVQSAVLRLPWRLQRAFAGRYLLVLKDDYSRLTNRERAGMVEMSYGTFRDRVIQAKRRIAGMLPRRKPMKRLEKRLVESGQHKW